MRGQARQRVEAGLGLGVDDFVLVERRLASRLIEHIGDLGIDVAVFRVGKEAEQGWVLTAHDQESGEWWRVEVERSLDGAVELAMMVGIVLEG